MVWTFEEAQAYLAATAPPGTSVYGLGRICHLLDLLDHPEKGYPCVTVVGTNGKGSVLAFLDSLFRAHGLKVVCHVKPHLESVTERIRIYGIDSTPSEFAQALWEVKDAIDRGWTRDDRATYFELIFAASLCAARSHGADIAILETGLGGRLDAVNSVDADLVVLTSVGYDHTELLGETLTEIVGEKLAVVRPGGTLVFQKNPEEVLTAVRNYCGQNHVNCIEMPGGTALIRQSGKNKESAVFTYVSASLGEIRELQPGLKGPYQDLNLHLALVALEIFLSRVQPGLVTSGLIGDKIRTGVAEARLPGRWEELRPKSVPVKIILDGAHNPDALRIVLDRFKSLSDGKKVILFGSKASKKINEIIPQLVGSADAIIFTSVPEVEYHSPEELAESAKRALDREGKFSHIHIDCVDSIMDALGKAIASAGEHGTVLVTGSLYLVGAVRGLAGHLSAAKARMGSGKE